MSRFNMTLAVAGALALASAAHAQPGGRAMGPPNGPPDGAPFGARMGGQPMGSPMMDVASMLLSHTGELKLTDQQVTRLAAIARRTADRRTSMMASIDSLRARRAAAPPNASGAPPTPPPEARALALKMRDQTHTDLRDAIAVLTPDQQATSWEMMARRGAGGGGAMRRRMGGRGGPGMGAGMRGRSGEPQPNQPQPRRNGLEPRRRPGTPAVAPPESPTNR